MKGTKWKIFFVSFCTCLAVGIVILINIAISQGIIFFPLSAKDNQEGESQPNDNNNESTETTKEENKGNNTQPPTQNMTEATKPTQESTTEKPTEKPENILEPNQTGTEYPGVTEEVYQARIQSFSGVTLKEVEEHDIGDSKLYFVGDSIIEDWGNYKYRLDRVFSSLGVDTYKILKQKLVEQKDGSKITIVQAIEKAKPDTLVIMLGSNDVEWMEGTKFTNFYNKFLDNVEKASPCTKILLQSITPIRNKKAQEWLSNERINYFNLLIANIAKTRGYQFINIADQLKDKDGQLLEKYDGGDGIHLSPEAYNVWLKYYKTHLPL